MSHWAIWRGSTTTRAALLHYLDVTQRRSARAITAYMRDYHQVSPGATRTLLWRLVHAGVVRRVRRGMYELRARVGQAGNEADPLTTH